MQPTMPQPTDDHRRLARLAGSWTGDEVLHPSPWSPERRRAEGSFEARTSLDGFFLVTDYVETQGGAVTYRGHGVYGCDAKTGEAVMYWFDNMGSAPAAPARGGWDGDRLTFEAAAEGFRARYVYELRGADAFTFRIDTLRDGAEWSPMMEGTYRRRPA